MLFHYFKNLMRLSGKLFDFLIYRDKFGVDKTLAIYETALTRNPLALLGVSEIG